MLNVDQITKLQLMELALVEITLSDEYKGLSAEDYHPDLNLVDALTAVSQVLDQHCPSSPYQVSPGFAEMFSAASLLNRVQILGDK